MFLRESLLENSLTHFNVPRSQIVQKCFETGLRKRWVFRASASNPNTS